MEKKFLLTRPSRDVTNESGIIYTAKTISTHTPLAGRDIAFPLVHPSMSFLLTRPSRDVTITVYLLSLYCIHFYSHAPRGT